MRLQTISLSVAVVTLSLLANTVEALPVRHLSKREDSLVEARAASSAPSAKRHIVIKRGYYVGGRKAATDDKVPQKRDRFAPYGYPISVVRRDNNAASAGAQPPIPSDDVRTATPVATSTQSTASNGTGNNTSDPSPTPPKLPSSNNSTSATITLPKGITASSNGFLFIPVTQQSTAASTDSNGKAASTQGGTSVTRQTFYVNIEAGLGSNGKAYQIDTGSGSMGSAAMLSNSTSSSASSQGAGSSGTGSANGGDSSAQNASGGTSPSTPNTKQKQVGNDSSGNNTSTKASHPSPNNNQTWPGGAGGGGTSSSQTNTSTSSGNSTDVRRIIFKPLQDPDSGSSTNAASNLTSSTVDVPGSDQAETQDLKDVNNGDDKKAAASSSGNGQSDSGTDDDSSSSAMTNSTMSASTGPSANVQATTNATSSSSSSSSLSTSSSSTNSTSATSKSGDNYFLFPVDKDAQQVDLSKGDMIAYVEHPATAASNLAGSAAVNQTKRSEDSFDYTTTAEKPPQRRDDLKDEKGVQHRDPTMYMKVRQDDQPNSFSRRAREFFKRNLVKGKAGAKVEYWKGQKFERSSSDDFKAITLLRREENVNHVQILRRSSAGDYVADGQPIFFLVKRDPDESLRHAESLFRRSS